ncbi:C-type lectin domain family 9 member A-like isoform X2 [Meles meles]|uniref:C-type lectin domain family 9 member A-like isoform X2 n=1 Tax=Meles meles TaxID=9662 RepID=UPI001E6A0F31|nr:C-type lectin domain family 9 member A-like isoform X2 [Meles meles]
MSEERVTYAELNLPNSRKQKGKRRRGNKKRGFPCHIVVLSLGVMCVILLLAITGIRSIYKDSDSFQGKWHCCGKSCYYFSKEEKTWEESKKSCEDLSSSLIKIDNKAEQNFIQSKISYNYWTGLHKIGANHPWKWLDGTPLSQMVNFQQSLRDAKCGHLKPSTLSTIDCQKPFHYICEKMFTGPCY